MSNPAQCRLAVILAHLLALFLVVAALPCPVLAQQQETDEELRKRALVLFKEHKDLEALPLFEKLVEIFPEDTAVLVGLATSLLTKSATMTDQDETRKIRVRVRALLIRAQDLGDKSDLLQTLLSQIPEGGGEVKFSDRREVDEAMRAGEAAFAKRDWDAALRAYERAFALDPKSYDAALFAGDVHYARKDVNNAGVWFAKAIALDPNRETAYRYWGDALMEAGRREEARSKYIEALVAQPYTRASWNGIFKYARELQLELTHPRIDSPNRVSQEKDKVTITIDPSTLGAKDGRESWMMYEITRAAWKTSKFKERFPAEKEYRHSLWEEAEALQLVADVLAGSIQSKTIRVENLDVSLANLRKLHEAGLIEPYVLYAKVDAGIAQDYEAYRKEHRQKLFRYLNEWVVPKPTANK